MKKEVKTIKSSKLSRISSEDLSEGDLDNIFIKILSTENEPFDVLDCDEYLHGYVTDNTNDVLLERLEDYTDLAVLRVRTYDKIITQLIKDTPDGWEKLRSDVRPN